MVQIAYEPTTRCFTLKNEKVSLILQLINGYPVQRYLGLPLRHFSGSSRLEAFTHAFGVTGAAAPYSLTTLPLAYSTIGAGDERLPGYVVEDEANQKLPILRFKAYHILSGLPQLDSDLPQFKVSDAQTLVITLEEPVTQLQIQLRYSLLPDLPVILTSTRFENTGVHLLQLKVAASLQLNVPEPFTQLVTLTGTHAHEANVTRAALRPGIQGVGSNHGASGPQAVPFMAFTQPQTTGNCGLALGTTLFWSGDFQAQAQLNQYGKVRATLELGDTDFQWQLAPAGSFDTPLAATVFSKKGLNGMAAGFHSMFKQYVLRPGNPRLVTFNTWETHYFAISEQKVQNQLADLKRLGVEQIVLDDGWFENRNQETGQLGDWQADPQKFPQGLAPLARACHTQGLAFGLWLEPEMVTKNSRLYQTHPDWILRYRDYEPLTSRHQLVLDLSRPQVQNFLLAQISKLISDNNLDYIKWDYNRHLLQPGSAYWPAAQQGEVAARCMLGLYHILGTLRRRFPKLIIENCSAGGGRLDAGMLCYSDQTWVSDLSDPVLRMRLMSGFALVFPPEVFASHVTASPNAQDLRQTPLNTRCLLTGVGPTGLECDPQQLTKADQEQLIAFFKDYRKSRGQDPRQLFQLAPPSAAREAAYWLLLSADKRSGKLLLSLGLTDPVHTYRTLALHYLDPELDYRIGSCTAGGDELNQVGITLPFVQGDFQVVSYTIEAVN